jgi:predicted  nucleic acid-binding Zn-ribbon protein
MLKQLIKKWLGLTALEEDHKDLSEEFTALESRHDDLEYDVQSKADDDRVDDVEGELNNVASNVDDIIIRLDDLEKEDA